MSEYTSYSYDYSPRVAATDLAQAAGLGAIGALAAAAVGVAALYRAIEEKAAALESTRLRAPEAWLGAIQSQPLAAAALAQAMPQFADLSRCADRGRLDAALPELRQALRIVNERLLAAEASVLRTHLADALGELGYELREPRRTVPGQVLLRATKTGSTEVAMRLTPQAGRFELDLSGFRGSACHAERARISEALRRRGVFLTEQVAQRHGRCEGGALVAEARALVDERAGVHVPLRNKERA